MVVGSLEGLGEKERSPFMTTTKRRHRHRFTKWKIEEKVEGLALRQRSRCMGRSCFVSKSRIAHYHGGNVPCFTNHRPSLVGKP